MTIRQRWLRRSWRRTLKRSGFSKPRTDQPPMDWQDYYRRGGTHVILSALVDGAMEAEVTRAKRGRWSTRVVYDRDALKRMVAFR